MTTKITILRKGGTDETKHAVGEEQESKEFEATNNPSNFKKGVLDQDPLIEPKKEEDTNLNEESRDGRAPEVHSTTDHRHSRFYDRHCNGSEAQAAYFVEKRNEDLNIMLIVASLFSVVTSAFIIYIHPQLQTDPNDETTALVRGLLYKAVSTTFGGGVPKVAARTGPPRTVVAALVLLSLGLAAAITTVLLAILAKQLLNLYTLTGAPGSNADDSESRQRRLRWFTAGLHGMTFFLSFLLQLALLLLTCALTVYIWRINLIFALFILVLTLCAVPIHLLLVSIAVFDVSFSRLQSFWERGACEVDKLVGFIYSDKQ